MHTEKMGINDLRQDNDRGRHHCKIPLIARLYLKIKSNSEISSVKTRGKIVQI